MKYWLILGMALVVALLVPGCTRLVADVQQKETSEVEHLISQWGILDQEALHLWPTVQTTVREMEFARATFRGCVALERINTKPLEQYARVRYRTAEVLEHLYRALYREGVGEVGIPFNLFIADYVQNAKRADALLHTFEVRRIKLCQGGLQI